MPGTVRCGRTEAAGRSARPVPLRRVERYCLGFLLASCVLRGWWTTGGLDAPAILDTFRDAGFTQGFLDGNWFGDPSIPGAARYYPPLIHAVFALAAAVSGGDPLRLLMAAAPWVNVVMPLAFFWMGRSLIGTGAALIGTALLILVNGWALSPWVTAAYHPWPSIPLLALAPFFVTLRLIHTRTQTAGVADALMIGSAIGLTFLAHTVPAVILAVVLPVATVAARGLQVRTAAWIALTGSVALAWSLPLLLPLYVSYRLHIENGGPGALVDPLLAAWPPGRAMLASILPGVLALPVVVSMRAELAVSRTAAAILAVWITVPTLFLVRHYACDATSQAAVCTTFVIAVHHWFLYLQAGLTSVAGLGAWWVFERWRQGPAWSARRAAVGWTVAASLTVAMLWLHPMDAMMRRRALAIAAHFDWEVYDWVRDHAAAKDLFVTEIAEESLNPASLAVMAAGRASVALAQTYSNPYVAWEPRNRRVARYLAAARTGGEDGAATLCTLLEEAGSGARAYVILPVGQAVAAPSLRPEWTGALHVVYRALPERCAGR